MVGLRTLGRVELTDAAGREITPVLAQPKRLVLLTYLAMASRRGYRSRDTLRALFWPELDDAHARDALNQACRFLRRHLGAEALVSRGNEEVLVPPSEVDCDAVAFDTAVERDDLDAAGALYRGELLEGVYVSGASVELQSWLDGERARLRRLATQVDVRLSGRAVNEQSVRRAPADAGQSAPAATRGRRLGVLPVAAALTVASLAMGAGWSAGKFSRSRLDTNLVAVAPFDVIGPHHPELREGLLDLVSASLDGAGPLRAVPVARVLQLWGGAAHSDSTTAESLARTTRAGLVIHGRVVATGGDSVRIDVSLLDASTGGTREFEVRDDVHRLDRIGDTISVAALRELGRTRAIGAVRTAAFGSRSLAAMRAFLRGEQYYRRAAADSATANYLRAVEIDPRFALAWRRLGAVRAWGRWESDSLIVAYRARAASLNVGLPVRESLLVVADSLYQALILQGRNVHWAEHQRRLFATLDAATTRYPDDVESWSQLGVARTYFPPDDVGPDRAFEAYDRALALDSAYLPAYEAPALLALYLDRPADAWRYLAARRRHDTTYARSDGARLVQRLVDPALRARDRELAIARASTQALADAAFALDLWRDSAETNVRLARALLLRQRPDSFGDRYAYIETLFGRGHPDSALAQAHGDFAWMHPVVLTQLGLAGVVPRAVVDARLEPAYADGRLGMVCVGLPLWAARRDTAAILRLQRALLAQTQAASAYRDAPAAYARSRRYNLARSAAYLALARGDSAEALRRFMPLAAPECVGCAFTALRMDRLTLAALLLARGRDREALALLGFASWFGTGASAFEVQAALQEGRVAQRLGEWSRARAAYAYVVHSWPHPDAALAPSVEEARRGLAMGDERRR